jgi:signal transduction histidine kinase
VRGDANALTTLISNLVDNAVRYTPAPGRVDVIVRMDGADAVLEVRDSGPGIGAGDRARVFDRFYRGTAAQISDAHGSGLGLAIVKRIAERHGTSVELGTGIDGRGLGVTVRFPLAESA